MPILHEYELAGGNKEFNANTRQRFIVEEIRNSFYNHATIVRKFREGQAADISDAPKVRAEPALILGSGPSFDKAGPLLKDWRGAVFCSPSQAATCVYYGKHPTHIVALDVAGHDIAQLEAAGSWEGSGAVFITHPGMRPNLIEGWRGPQYFYRKSSPLIAFYTNAQAVGYSWDRGHGRIELIVRTLLLPFGCVVPAEVFLANMLGYCPVFLVGVDFGYPEYVSRFMRWSRDSDGEWQSHPPPPLAEYGLEVMHADNGCPSDIVQLFYKRQMISAWRLEKGKIVNTAVDGTLDPDTFPQADIAEVIQRQGKGYKPYGWKKVCEVTERFLAQSNSFVLEYDGGIKFIESANPMKELPGHFQYLRQKGVKSLDERANLKRIGRAVEQAAKIKAKKKEHAQAVAK